MEGQIKVLWRNVLLLSVAGFVLLSATWDRVTAFQKPMTVIDLPEAAGVIKLEFGLKATEPREWNGSMIASAGEILFNLGLALHLPGSRPREERLEFYGAPVSTPRRRRFPPR